MLEQDMIERALDEGRLEALMTSGKWWRVRRNGQTKVWKTRPGHFQIPCKAGLHACAYIRHDNLENYRIVEA